MGWTSSSWATDQCIITIIIIIIVIIVIIKFIAHPPHKQGQGGLHQ